MRAVGIVAATFAWVACWLIAPASWWLNEKILDEQAFQASMTKVLQIENVDTVITDRATAQVMDDARAFVDRTAPIFSTQADFLLDKAQPTVSGLVNTAVNSQPGERAMLAMSTQMHNAFVAWLDQDTLGRPGLQADLNEGEAHFDLDELLAGQALSLGPVSVPLDALQLPGISVPFPLPPDWLRLPLTVLRNALLPALIGIVVCGGLLVILERGRLRALAVASGLTAGIVAIAALVIRSAWTVSGGDDPEWTITRAIGELLVAPWVTAYVVVAVVLALLGAGSLVADRMVVRHRRA